MPYYNYFENILNKIDIPNNIVGIFCSDFSSTGLDQSSQALATAMGKIIILCNNDMFKILKLILSFLYYKYINTILQGIDL